MEFPNARVRSVTFSPAICNGAGTVKTLEDVRAMATCPAGAVTVGSSRF
ncbi:MAG: hypothetical protein U1C57_01050 [Candidatus Doudnabacteria bacterium]|nr:hypothetical protein [Candidatus Doudnabacteria bacterium]